ncbi:M6 family metalloprotease domain-containing protein [Limnoglobus roseus]|uniref:PDZ domain-containing protein n=1 Tax=Limnoglobus roseus TaxID=2598579 RepID=A0A5C1AIE0_9BACT|nr:M6 family metalloprotease domain-containing protein [Limnoglobus roseus]QEL16894.1 PDZ domain-containing protein [Limnoglobus roseus]
MRSLTLTAVLALASPVFAAEPSREVAPAPTVGTDLSGYHTTKDAVTADPKTFKFTETPTTAGYLGVEIVANKAGRPIIDEVQSDSPADDAGVKVGDVLVSIAGDVVLSPYAARDKLRGRAAGEVLKIQVDREGQAFELSATLRAVSKPFKLAGAAERPVLGISIAPKDGGLEILETTQGGGAENAGLKKGDVILKVNQLKVESETGLREILGEKKAGDGVTLTVKKEKSKEELDVRAILGGDRTGRTQGGGITWDDRLPRGWTKPSYKLAILGIDYPDVKHNTKVTDSDWADSLFSRGKYNGRSATGQKVHGSMNDYYKEISYDQFKIDGKFLGWVEVSKKRMEYSSGNGVSTREKTALLTEAFDKLLATKGKDALDGYDGVFFLFAGERVQTTRGSLYWPHRASFRHNNKSWPYFIVQEGGPRMTDISVFCHEFGHMLGLPDLYAKPEVPGMEGVGSWCAMSQQNPAGRPQHFSAWCKQELGWIKPMMIDPTKKQKLILAPIEDAKSECFKIPVRPDGSEYFLLENRRKTGFDTDLPAEGLLVWRVIAGRGRESQPVFLEESHGIEGINGPRSFTGSVPFPSPANSSFTPFTTPSSKSQLGGGYDVYITNIKRLRDGRIAFNIGYEFQ